VKAKKFQGCLRSHTSNRDGAALSMVIIVMFMCSILGIALINLSGNNAVENGRRIQASQTMWTAESGIHHAVAKILNDTTYRNNPTGLSGSIGNGTYTVAVSKSGTTYTLLATGVVQTTTRSVREIINLQGDGWHQTFLDFAYYGDSADITVDDDSRVCGDVFQDGNVMITDGSRITCGKVYATGTVTGNGTPGDPAELNPYPEMPGLETSYYDSELTLAADTGFDGTWNGTVTLNGGDLYVNGDVNTRQINGSGRLIATGRVTIQDNANVDDEVVIISDRVRATSENWVIGDRCVFYANSDISMARGGPDDDDDDDDSDSDDDDDDDDQPYTLAEGVLISLGTVSIIDVEINGIIYSSNSLLLDDDATVRGSVVAYLDGEIDRNSTLTHDIDEFPDTVPPGLQTGDSTNMTVTVISWSEL